MKITRIEDLIAEVEKVYILADKSIIKVLEAVVIANKMPFSAPVWFLLVAPSGGGKSEFLKMLTGLPYAHFISDLTTNTFASGFKGSGGEETSLLHKIDNGIMVFKDFTSILSMNRDKKREIIAQLREIFDGRFDKRTGNTKETMWEGKIGAIAGSTEIIYERMGEMSAMGDRFILYSVPQPDRKEVSRRVMQNANDLKEKQNHLQDCFKQYTEFVLDNLPANDIQFSEEFKERLIDVADFATLARSAVLTDDRTGHVTFVPAPEMPTRVIEQLMQMASAFVAMKMADPLARGREEFHTLSHEEEVLLFKIAFDSIPKKRQWALECLAGYKGGVHTAGLATATGYSTDVAKSWLFAVNALGLVTREKQSGPYGDLWKLKEEYRDIWVKYKDIEVKDEILQGRASDFEDDTEEDLLESIDVARAYGEMAAQEGYDINPSIDDEERVNILGEPYDEN